MRIESETEREERERLEVEMDRQDDAYATAMREKYGDAAWEAYLEHCEAEEREDEARRRAGGLQICPRCGERTLRSTAIPTRQYGGGADTLYRCENGSCDYREICV